MIDAPDLLAARPYLIRAMYEWCCDSGFTPYVAVAVDDSVRVPREYVKDNEIVLNISFDATSSLQLGNEFIEFKARFGGVARDIMVPIHRVIAIYARENGQGMAFPPASVATMTPTPTPTPSRPTSADLIYSLREDLTASPPDEPEPPKPSRTRPALKRVK